MRTAVAIAVGGITACPLLGTPSARANTADNVVNGQSDLTASGTYASGSPGTTSDVTFPGGTPYSRSTFTLNNFNLNIGTLDDLNKAITIQDPTAGDTSTITLNGGTNATGGADPADLIYVASGGALTVQNGSGTLNVAVNSSGNFDVAGTGSLTIGSTIIGNGFALTKTGAGILTLSGNNNFGGPITLSQGTLSLNSSGALGGATSLTINGATTLNAGVSSFTLPAGFTESWNGTWTFTGNSVTLGTSPVILNGENVTILNYASATMTVGGNISGSSSLTKGAVNGSTTGNNSGPELLGATVLSGTNTYTGDTNIYQGLLLAASAGAIGGSGRSVLIQDIAPGSTNFQGAMFGTNYALDQTILSRINTNSVGTLSISGSPTIDTNALDFSAATGANLSNVSLGSVGVAAYAGTLTPFNTTYQLGGGGTLNVTSALANVGGSAANLIVNPTFTGSIVGQVTLGGAQSTYTGTTTVDSGTLKLDFALNNNHVVTNVLSPGSTLALGSSATFVESGNSDGSASSQTLAGLTLLDGSSTITQTLSTASSLTLNLGTINRATNATVNFSVAPSSAVLVNATNPADASGQILGPWATIDTGVNTTYAGISPTGSITALSYSSSPKSSQGTLIADAGANLKNPSINYSLSAAPTAAIATPAAANTLRYTAGAGTLTLGAGGSLMLNGLLNAGTGLLTIADSGSNGIVIGASRELVLNAANGGITIKPIISDNPSGASSLTITGGTVTLNAANTYTGGTTIDGGTLLIGSANAVLGTGRLVLSGGAVNTGTTATLANPIFVTAGTNTAIDPTANLNSLTLTGALTGSGSITTGGFSFSGSPPYLSFNGDNRGFMGTLVFNGRADNSLNLRSVGNTAASNNWTQATIVGENYGTRRFTIAAGQVFQVGAVTGALQFQNNTYSGAESILQIGALNTNDTFSGGLSTNGSGVVSLTKVGTGTLTLNNSDGIGVGVGNYGATPMTFTVNGGRVVLDMTNMPTPTAFFRTSDNGGSPVTVLNGGAVMMLAKGGTLQASSQTFQSTTLNAGSSAVVVNANGGMLGAVLNLSGITRTTSGGTVDFTLPAGIQSSANGLTTTSTAQLSGVMVQDPTNSVAYATVNGGADWASLSGTSGTVNIVPLGSAAAIGGYAPDAFAGGNTDVTANDRASGVSSATLRFNVDGVALTYSGANKVVAGGILATRNTGGAGATITGGTLTTGGGREFDFADYGKLTVASQLVDSGGGATILTKSGPGTLILASPNNTYTGASYLNGGVTQIAADGSLGVTIGAAKVALNGGTLQLAPGYASTLFADFRKIDLGYNGGTIDTNGNDVTYAGSITSNNAVLGTTAENTAGQFTFTKAGAGTLTLSHAQPYMGATMITGGTLSVSYLNIYEGSSGIAGGLGRSDSYAKNLILNGGTLQYNSAGTGETSDRLFSLGDNGGALDASGSGPMVLSNTGAVGYVLGSNGAPTNASPTLTLTGTNTGANTLAASLGNNGIGSTSLVKSGPGTWILTGPNLFTGQTMISAGTLEVDGSLGDTPVSVAKGATLAGKGTIGNTNANAVAVGGTIAPGNAMTVGTLGTGPQAWNAGGSYTWKLANAGGAPGIGWDQVTMSTFALNSSVASPFTINVTPLGGGPVANFNAGSPYTWIIAHSNDGNFANLSANQLAQNFALNTSALNNVPGMTGGGSYSLAGMPDPGAGSDLAIVYSPAPEPTSLALAGLAAGGLLLRRRRQ